MLSYVSLNSKDSLEEFLQLYQCKDSKKKTILNKEREIIRYLKGLGLQMKTDPLLKLQNISNFIIQGDQSPDSNDEIIIKKQQIQDNDIDIEFNISNNPLIKRGSRRIIRTFSFENQNQILNNNKDIVESHHFD